MTPFDSLNTSMSLAGAVDLAQTIQKFDGYKAIITSKRLIEERSGAFLTLGAFGSAAKDTDTLMLNFPADISPRFDDATTCVVNFTTHRSEHFVPTVKDFLTKEWFVLNGEVK